LQCPPDKRRVNGFEQRYSILVQVRPGQAERQQAGEEKMVGAVSGKISHIFFMDIPVHF